MKPSLVANADLRARAITAYQDRCAAARAAEQERLQERELRGRMLLVDLLQTYLQLDIDLRDVQLTPVGPRITLDGIEFGIAHDDDGPRDELIVYRRCSSRRCANSDPTGQSSVWHAPFAWDAISSLADLGQLLAEPWLCGTCASRRQREEQHERLTPLGDPADRVQEVPS